MPLQTINIGASANDGTGDPLRTAFDKVNENFALLDTVFNVLDQAFAGGADPTGAADSTAAIQAAINTIDAAGGGVLYFPTGTYKKLRTSANIVLCSNITVRGDGMGKSIVQLDDTGGGTGFAFIAASKANIQFEDISLRGSYSQPDNVEETSQYFQFADCTGYLNLFRVESSYSRSMGIIISRCENVSVTFCHVHHNDSDGIAVWNCPDAYIAFNRVHDNDDDGISAHVDDATALPILGGIRIVHNNMWKSQGISCLGPKVFDISHNTMHLMHSYAVSVTYADNVDQGNTPVIWGRISCNTCPDVIIRPQGGNTANMYMRLGSGQKNAGTGNNVAPGMPDSVAGAIEDLYGADTGHFYTNNTDDTTVPSAGGFNIHVFGNIMGRSRPEVDNYSDYGLGALWPGNWDTEDYDGPVEDADYACDGLVLEPYLRNVKIYHNTFWDTRYGIYVKSGASPADLAFWNIEIVENTIHQFSDYGINFEGTSLSEQLFYVRSNNFDGDPLHKNGNRGSNGTWQANTLPLAVRISAVGGFHLERNHYSNVAACTSANQLSGNTILREVVHCDPAAVGFSTSNKGVGNVPRAGASYWHIIEGCDIAAADYGIIKSPTLHTSSSRPSTGTYVPGHFVSNDTPALSNRNHVIGWMRNTLGSGHVGATDWFDCYCTSSPGCVNQSTSTDNAIPRFNGTSGVFIENTALILDDNTNLTGASSIAFAAEAITGAGALTLSKAVHTLSNSSGSSYAVTLAAPTSAQYGIKKTIEMIAGDGTNTVTLALTNINGGSAGTTATFDAAGEKLVLEAGATKWAVIKEQGVTLS